MKHVFTLLFVSFIYQSTVKAQYFVVPPAYESTVGTGTFLGPLANAQRTYQMLIHENQLTGLVGRSLQGISFRLRHTATANWPAADVSFTNYDIFLSQGVAPVNRNLADFNANIVGTKTQVRSGALSIAAGSYTIGATPAAFGTPIEFSSPYSYTGGHLLLEIRHSGFTGTSSSVDALVSSTPGFGTDFSACWTGSYVGTGGTNGNFSVFRFSTNTVVPLNLTRFTARLQSNNALLNWSTEQEINTSRFEIERSFDGRNFSRIGSVVATGSVGSMQEYNYIDAAITSTASDVLYYRLKMLDTDQRFTYSPISIINIKRNAAIVTLYPNPVNDASVVRISAANNEQLAYRIVSAVGQSINSGVYTVLKGTNDFPLNSLPLKPGNYYLVLEGKFTRERIPFVK